LKFIRLVAGQRELQQRQPERQQAQPSTMENPPMYVYGATCTRTVTPLRCLLQLLLRVVRPQVCRLGCLLVRAAEVPSIAPSGVAVSVLPAHAAVSPRCAHRRALGHAPSVLTCTQ
jgi:hypothetical protein